MTPRLESWEAKTHPAQIALAKYLDHIERLLVGRMPADDGLSLELIVGVPDAGRLLKGGDLDNYAFPVIRRLGAARLSSVWVRKEVGADHTICVGAAQRAPEADLGELAFVRTRCRSSKRHAGVEAGACRWAVYAGAGSLGRRAGRASGVLPGQFEAEMGDAMEAGARLDGMLGRGESAPVSPERRPHRQIGPAPRDRRVARELSGCWRVVQAVSTDTTGRWC